MGPAWATTTPAPHYGWRNIRSARFSATGPIARRNGQFSDPLNKFRKTRRCPVLEKALKRAVALPNSTNYTARELNDMVAGVEVALKRALKGG